MSNPFGSPPPRRGGTTPYVEAVSNYRAPRSSNTGTVSLPTPRDTSTLSDSLRRNTNNTFNDPFTSPTALANARLRDQLSQVSICIFQSVIL